MRKKKRKKKERKKAKRKSLELLTSGCSEHQNVPGVRIPGMSCLASGRSRQDVADWSYAHLSRLLGLATFFWSSKLGLYAEIFGKQI